MINTRRYINSFIEINAEVLQVICYNKAQATEMKEKLFEAVAELQSFIDECKD